MEEENILPSESMELVIDRPALSESGMLTVTGNFTELKTKIQAVVDKYRDTKLTAGNLGYVKTVKSHFTALRTSIDKSRKEWKKIYITPASKTIDGMCDELQKLVAEGEDALSEQLKVYDEARKAELTEIIKGYVDEAVKTYGIRPEFVQYFEYREKYYNKTQSEEDTIADIDAQGEEICKKQCEHDSAIELIRAECLGTKLLAETYIRNLEYKSPMEIILDIKKDKALLSAEPQSEKAEEKETPAEAEKAMEKIMENYHDEMRERIFRIQYHASQADLITEFFKKNGIKCLVVRKE